MKRGWIIPEFNGLGVEFTEAAGPTATYFAITPEGPGSTYKWQCNCCGAESSEFFATTGLAEADFNANHKNSCPKWNYEVGACAIS